MPVLWIVDGIYMPSHPLSRGMGAHSQVNALKKQGDHSLFTAASMVV